MKQNKIKAKIIDLNKNINENTNKNINTTVNTKNLTLIPKIYQEAISSNESDDWKEAINKDIDDMYKNNVI